VKELHNIVEDSKTVDPKHHRHLGARRCEVLRRIGDEFGGVVVSFPRNGVAGDKVNLKGAWNCIDAAIAWINEILMDLKDMVTIDCEIELTYHRTVMGVPRAPRSRRSPLIATSRSSSLTKLLRIAEKSQWLPMETDLPIPTSSASLGRRRTARGFQCAAGAGPSRRHRLDST